MAKLVQTLIPILFLLASTVRSQTSFYYDFSQIQHSNSLTFQGQTHFVSSSSPGFLRLTNGSNDVVGRVMYSHPVQFWQAGSQVDFETTFTFLITPSLGHQAAEGLVFFIAPVGFQIPDGAGGANFGIFDFFGNAPFVLAVEFDNYIDSDFDPNYRHIGIDLGSRISMNTTNVGEALIGQQVTAKINYVAATKMITALVTAGLETFNVSYKHDLSDFLTDQVQVGLSASTGLFGNYTSTHDILEWRFACTMVDTSATTIRQVV